MYQVAENAEVLKLDAKQIDELNSMKGAEAFDQLAKIMEVTVKDMNIKPTYFEMQSKCKADPAHKVNKNEDYSYSCEGCNNDPFLPRNLYHQRKADCKVRQPSILDNEHPNFIYRPPGFEENKDIEVLKNKEAFYRITDMCLNKKVSNRVEVEEWKNNKVQELYAKEGNNVQAMNRLFRNVLIRWDDGFERVRLDAKKEQ